jgi:hypothetical protein
VRLTGIRRTPRQQTGVLGNPDKSRRPSKPNFKQPLSLTLAFATKVIIESIQSRPAAFPFLSIMLKTRHPEIKNRPPYAANGYFHQSVKG